MKQVQWLGSSYQRLMTFPKAAIKQVGFQLWKVQEGEEPDDWKNLSGIGPGVFEIRIHEQGEYRIVIVAKFPAAVYVLHAFEKKTQKTPYKDLSLARSAYAKISKI